MNAGTLFMVAWRVAPRLPGPVVRGIFDLVAIVAHTVRVGGVAQLEKNLSKMVSARGRALRRLSRRGMRSYMRYYAESFALPGMSPETVAARVRAHNGERSIAALEEGRSVVAALTHSGNWDLAGAWFVQTHGHVLTVAETLEPEELFREFLAFRESLGITVVPFARGAGVLRTLITKTRAGASLVPLLADRDLSRDGIEVTFGGHPMRVAPGPAALAIATGRDLVAIHIRYERLSGSRRRAARSPWGTVLTFSDPIEVPQGPRTAAIAQMTQRWADFHAQEIAQYPQDWHMLQQVFTADLDPERLARAASGPAS